MAVKINNFDINNNHGDGFGCGIGYGYRYGISYLNGTGHG
jgi:hypothetical protein